MAVRSFSWLKHPCLIQIEVYALRFTLGNEPELRKKAMLLHSWKLNDHNWFAFRLVGIPSSLSSWSVFLWWLKRDRCCSPALLCSQVSCTYTVQCSREMFHTLGRGNSWRFDLLHLPQKRKPEQKTRASRIWVGVLAAAAPGCHLCWGARAVTLHLPVQGISDKLHWDSRGSGSSGEGTQQENCFWTKGFWRCYLGGDLFQWLCKPKSILRS